MQCSANLINPATYNPVAFEAVNNALHRLTGTTLRSCKPVRKGANSSVYHLVFGNREQFALKFYPPLSIDSRDRLNVEYGAFSFLRQQGEKQVPDPLLVFDEHNAGVYRWIPGASVQTVQHQDISGVLNFMQRLHSYKEHPAAKALCYASEAFVSYDIATQQLARRWQRLSLQAESIPGLKNFLEERYKPNERMLLDYLERNFIHCGNTPSWHTPVEDLTLSPSDFGFHNAIKCPNGELVFLDFEYFGWDDAAKLMADFLWHPAMTLSTELKSQFVEGALAIYAAKDLARRLKVQYVLCGLRWCLIMLNEFIPQGRAKRRLAGKLDSENESKQLAEQLHKAENTLEILMNTYDNNPYAN